MASGRIVNSFPGDFDPTAIEIDSDPLQRRLRGVTAHGSIDFDVPYISEIVPGIWLGGCESGLVLPDHIDHLVSLYPWERYVIRHQLLTELYVTMFDSEDQSTAQVGELAEWVNSRRGEVLVHCQAGLNRSSLIVGAALILRGMDPVDAIGLIRERRSYACLCNKSFARALFDFCP